MSTTVRRPAGVTFVVVLTWIVAFVDLVGGAALLWLSLNMDRVTVDIGASDLRAYGISLLAIGLLTVAMALGLAAGTQLSRVIVMILMILRIAGAIYAYVEFGDLVRWQSIGQGVAAALVIAILFTPRASAFFRSA
ncbi:hypothetical protein [Demequina sp.]|uniref:hypothetical protein n=1 Tax=Demequina sp. TaxID=2050685 RepID=UPI0025F731E5|nr:hypothetical protein [Demequina sp.]